MYEDIYFIMGEIIYLKRNYKILKFVLTRNTKGEIQLSAWSRLCVRRLGKHIEEFNSSLANRLFNVTPKILTA